MVRSPARIRKRRGGSNHPPNPSGGPPAAPAEARRLVAPGPPGPRDLGVGDVPDQGVPEEVLVLVLDRRGPGPVDELLALQLGQPGPNRLVPILRGARLEPPG